ncbi:MAG TPA: type II toxin-antitoxin system VapB family antitoxin [Stellaceae bacterium]|nr:type II toxin-antitoxin system VapB family antitoxin [Stellaceae bacterium]
MPDQVHIRNAEAAQLARTLARQTGKTLTGVVLDALRHYQPGRRETARSDVAVWRELLRQDRGQSNPRPEVSIASLYDPVTGLPA